MSKTVSREQAKIDDEGVKALETCPWCGGKASPMKKYPYNYDYAQCMAYLHDWTAHAIWNCGEPDIGCRWVPSRCVWVRKSELKHTLRSRFAWISWSETIKSYPMVSMVPAKDRKPRSRAERFVRELIRTFPESSMSKERGRYMEVHVRKKGLKGTVRVQLNSLHGPGKIWVTCREGRFEGDYNMEAKAVVAVVYGFLFQINSSTKKPRKNTEVVWG